MPKSLTTPWILWGGHASSDANDIRYATGFSASDPFIFAQNRGSSYLIVSELEAARAAVQCPAATLYTPQKLKKSASRPDFSEQIVLFLKQKGWKTVQVGSFFPVSLFQAMKKAGISVKMTENPPFPSRAIKKPDEIRHITESQQAAVAAMKRAIALLRQSEADARGILRIQRIPLTSERLKQEIEEELNRRNCMAVDTIASVGLQTSRPHDTGSGPIRLGDPVVLDIFPRHKIHGYWGDITRTVVKGPSTPEFKKMYRTVFAAQKMALAMIRPGMAGKTIQRAVETAFQRAGYETRLFPPGKECGFIHSVGHGVGLDIHEAPRISHTADRLREGHVVTVEPGLYDPCLGGVRIEDTVAVTPHGCKILATCPKVLEL